ncbi:MAG: hypothetical protein MR779_04525 [Tenericutes bacterium]|nr:hypothetical protein [Mycoplasmatota bacterium]
MLKIIKIDNTDYKMKSSAYTAFAYKDETGRNFLSDIIKLSEYNDIKENNMSKSAEMLDELNLLLLRIAYVMIKEADESQVSDFKSFVKSIESLYKDSKWTEEVIELAVIPISGQLQNSK